MGFRVGRRDLVGVGVDGQPLDLIVEVLAEEFLKRLVEGRHFWRTQASVELEAPIDYLNLFIDGISELLDSWSLLRVTCDKIRAQKRLSIKGDAAIHGCIHGPIQGHGKSVRG